MSTSSGKVYPRMQKGKDWENRVRLAFEQKGWIVVGPAGVPDLICMKDGKIRFVECKAGKEYRYSLRTVQRRVRDAIQRAGYVWIVACETDKDMEADAILTKAGGIE